MPLDNKNEIFVVVDENDKIVGYRTRYECHRKNLIHRAIGVVVFNEKGEILLQKRTMSKDTSPGMYTLSAAGHVSKGETYQEAAERELFEEIGIKTKIFFAEKFLLRMENQTEMEVTYKAQHNGPFKIDASEVEEVKFFEVEEIKNILNQISSYAIECLKRMKLI
mgnify:CR=1 FL=1